MKICATCNVEMCCDKNDVPVEIVAGFGSYQLWSTDRWKCPKCQCAVLLTGPTQRPVAEHYEAKYSDRWAHYRNDPNFVRVEVK
jgi:hypothetical protein